MAAGFAVLLIAGICQGSFGLGYKKYSPFSWAAFWFVYSLICLVISAGFAFIKIPAIWGCISDYSIISVICGMLWGVSAVAFSRAVDKIGMSMVYGISMGISTVVGSLTPMIMNGTFSTGYGAIKLCVGLMLTIMGIVIITVAGMKRDKETKGAGIGYILAIVSGLGSGAMNIGFSASVNIESALDGYSYIAVSAAKWLPVLFGGNIAGAIWCAAQMCINRKWNTMIKRGAALRTAKLFGVGIVWYCALLLYGLSARMLGDRFSGIGWIIFNALALLVSTAWGLKTGEWRGHSKKLLFAGCAVLVAAWIFM